MSYLVKFILLGLCICTWSACNDSLFFGSDLLEQDQLELGTADTLSVTTTTISEDSILVFDPAAKVLDAFLIGNYKDPVFGTTNATAYLQYRLGSTSVPDFSNSVFDSIVLSLVYDTVRPYGNYKQPVTFEVSRLDESMSSTVQYYSKKHFAASGNLGTLSFTPNPFSSVSYIDYPGGFPDTLSSRQIRIRLNDALGKELMDTSHAAIYKTNDAFQALFKGIKISSNTQTGGITAYNPLDAKSKITLYYRHIGAIKDTSLQYEFIVSTQSARTVAFDHDYTGSLAGSHINTSSVNDSLLFLQGMGGTQIKVDVPSVSILNNRIINKAELEFYIKKIDFDDPVYTPVNNIIIGKKDDAGNLSSINDVLFAIAKGSETGLGTYFGGKVTSETINGELVYKYKMNISAHLQKMITSGKDSERVIYLIVYRRQEVAGRVVLYGGASKILAPKLRIVYTKLIQ